MIHLDPFDTSLFQHRFVFFSGGPGGGPSEGFGPDEGTGGVSEEAAERAAEERAASAQAAKTQKREEKKMKKRDDKLADIIRALIQGGTQNDTLTLLVSRLLERNTPVNVVLAVLSLYYQDVIEALEDYLQDEQEILPDETPDEDFSERTTALVQYGQELSQALSSWTTRIFTHASFHPMKTIISLAHFHGVDSNMIQLTTLMINRFFRKSGQEIELDRVRQFSELYWTDALKRLHKLADDRGLLPEPSEDPLYDDDDED